MSCGENDWKLGITVCLPYYITQTFSAIHFIKNVIYMKLQYDSSSLPSLRFWISGKNNEGSCTLLIRPPAGRDMWYKAITICVHLNSTLREDKLQWAWIMLTGESPTLLWVAFHHTVNNTVNYISDWGWRVETLCVALKYFLDAFGC